jgi:hypothetical protein
MSNPHEVDTHMKELHVGCTVRRTSVTESHRHGKNRVEATMQFGSYEFKVWCHWPSGQPFPPGNQAASASVAVGHQGTLVIWTLKMDNYTTYVFPVN